MYLRTPKRYSSRGRRRRGGISLRTVLIWILTPIFIVVGIGVYENREMLQDDVNQIVGDVVNDVGEGIDNINTAPATPTPDPTTDIERAQASWNRGSIQEAVSAYQRAVSSAPNDLNVHYYLTYGLLLQGRNDEALIAAENTITANPFSSDAWAIRARALSAQGRPGEALASATHAIELITGPAVANPDDPAVITARARALAAQAEAHLLLEQPETARGKIDEALELNPFSPEALHISGLIWESVPYYDFDAARADFAEANAVAPQLLNVTLDLARTERFRFDNPEYALELYQNIVERNPGNSLALLELGAYYYRIDQAYERAAEMFTRCIDANPNYAPCHYWQGRNLVALEQPNSAIEPLQTAINLDEETSLYYWWLGEAYIGLGQCPQAIPQLQRGRQLASEDLLGDFDDSLGRCGAATGLIPAPSAPTAEAETTPEAIEAP